MLATDLVSLLLRVGELAFSATVAGLTGEYLHQRRGARASTHKRHIYTIVVAAISILFSLLFLLPFLASFAKWPVDLILFVLWIVAFALLADFNGDNSCGSIWRWGNVTQRNQCGKYKANMAFSFLAAIFFLVSAILGFWVMRKQRRGTRTEHVKHSHTTTGRRKWYGRRGASRV